MARLLAALVICALPAATSGEVTGGVRCALSVHQWDRQQSSHVLLYADTADFLRDTHVTGFAAGLSMDVEVTSVDTAGVRMTVHVHTFAPQPDHAARSFQVEFGLPARIENLLGKNGARYSLTLVPLEAIDIDTAWCPYSHHTVEDFHVDPSAHMNIYFVPQTLGDFHWNAIKGMLENEYDNFGNLTSFSMPGKYYLYLCPCQLSTVIWDDRFGMMVDPVRSTMFAIYAKEFNSVYPFLVSQAAIYHNYGYAPSFLSDGFANYFSFAIYDLKKLRSEGKLIPLDSLLDSYAYYQIDPRLADRISATFVRYLIDAYRIGDFLELYQQADDLNLRAGLEQTYGKTVGELEAEWLGYVDSVTVSFGQAAYFALQAETMLDYDLMLEYARELLRLAASRPDSIQALAQMSRAGFFAGDYYTAAGYQVRYLELVDSVAGEWMKLAGYRMMSGEYKQAAADLQRAAEIDSTNALVTFNRALNSLYRGDTLRARQTFASLVAGGGPDGRIESQLMLADLLAQSNDETDRTEATTFYHAAVGLLSRQDRRHNPSATQTMWLGIAYLGLDDTGNAGDFLQTALFLETRPFYAGMINLWLGKAADARAERALARDYYRRVLAGAAAHYHQEEARRLLEQPYRR